MKQIFKTPYLLILLMAASMTYIIAFSKEDESAKKSNQHSILYSKAGTTSNKANINFNNNQKFPL